MRQKEGRYLCNKLHRQQTCNSHHGEGSGVRFDDGKGWYEARISTKEVHYVARVKCDERLRDDLEAKKLPIIERLKMNAFCRKPTLEER